MKTNTDIFFGSGFEQYGEVKALTLGDTLTFQGDSQDELILILKGVVEASLFSEGGNEVWINRYREGDFIGHEVLLDNGHALCELTAKTDLKITRVPRSRLKDLFGLGDQTITPSYQISKNFAKHIECFQLKLADAFLLSTKDQICAELIRLAVEFEHNKYIIRPNPVFVELARRINTSRETVSRTVGELEKRGIIKREPGAIILEDINQLRRAFG